VKYSKCYFESISLKRAKVTRMRDRKVAKQAEFARKENEIIDEVNNLYFRHVHKDDK
jgi:hypothetical protein